MQLCRLSSLAVVVAVAACSSPAPEAFSGARVPPAGRIERATASGTLTTLYSFQGQPDGANRQGSIGVFDVCSECKVSIYGSTPAGGTNDAGTIYSLEPQSQSGFTETILLNYTPSTTGSDPDGVVVREKDGSEQLFAFASQGGTHGKGTVIETFRGTAQLSFNGHDGAFPNAGLIHQYKDPIYYATTFAGGRYHRGAIVSIRITRHELFARVLYSFSGKSDGEHPNSGLALFGNRYYGTTAGSKSASGTVYRFVPGQDPTTLYTFHSGITPDGVTVSERSWLYGTTLNGGSTGDGTLYELKPTKSTYTKTILHTFTGGSADGSSPQGSPVFLNATLYGVTSSGGPDGCGTIYSVGPLIPGTYALRYSFACADDGAYPQAPLTVARYTGLLYGTASEGGTANKGVVFSYNPPN